MKLKLSFHCGTSPSAMVLTLHDEGGGLVATLLDDSRKLGFYSPRDGFTLHITDTDPGSASAGGWLEDTSLVEKYRMSDADYAKRENTYRKWKVRAPADGYASADPQRPGGTRQAVLVMPEGRTYVLPCGGPAAHLNRVTAVAPSPHCRQSSWPRTPRGPLRRRWPSGEAWSTCLRRPRCGGQGREACRSGAPTPG